MTVEPLTPRLLRARTVAIFQRVSDEHGPIEEVIFERVVCDGCGTVVHLLRDGYPVDWTTSGNIDDGWFDLCERCSRDDQRFTCPRCGMTSAHPKDVEHGYCGNCHDWTVLPR